MKTVDELYQLVNEGKHERCYHIFRQCLELSEELTAIEVCDCIAQAGRLLEKSLQEQLATNSLSYYPVGNTQREPVHKTNPTIVCLEFRLPVFEYTNLHYHSLRLELFVHFE